MKKLLKRLTIVTFVLLVILCVAALSWPLMVAGPSFASVAVQDHAGAVAICNGHHIRLMSANLAHGRSDGVHQMRQTTDAITQHLSDVAAVIKRVQPDCIAVQEADAPSWWSGSFDHVAFIAEQSNYTRFVHGPHVDGFGLTYGTGFISRLTIDEAWAYTFDPTSPTLSKGFSLIKIPMTHPYYTHMYLASLHTDFASATARRHQLNALAEVLLGLDAPFIVLGDFNCEFLDDDSPLPHFLERLQLKTFKPMSEDASLKTFRSLQARIDWICIPEHWEFQQFKVLDDVVSDHALIVADVKIISPSP